MIVRVRSNVGVWRIEVPAGGTVQDVLNKAQESHAVSQLYDDPACSGAPLNASQVLQHGSMVFTKVKEQSSSHPNMRRVVGKDGSIQFVENNESSDKGFRKGLMPLRDMKMHWTLSDFVAMDSQYEFKLKRQETAVCQQVSLDVPSVSDFQTYCQRFAFKRKRVAYLYGKYVDAANDKDDNKQEGEDKKPDGDGATNKKVLVEAIYEPPQEIDNDTAEGFVLLDDELEESVQEIAGMLGLARVGWIFCHEQRDFALSNAELIMAAEFQLEAAEGIHETPFVTVTVSPNENNAVSVEAFQVSQQCMAMVAEQALEISENPQETLINETFTAIQEGKQSKTVENSFFLVVVPIVQHTSETYIADFPRLNRDLDDRTPSHDELKKSLQKSNRDGWNFTDRLADFNLLLYLSKFLDRHADFPKICAAIVEKAELEDGYKLIIKSLAGMEGSY